MGYINDGDHGSSNSVERVLIIEGKQGEKGEPGLTKEEIQDDLTEVLRDLHKENVFSYLLAQDASKFLKATNSTFPIAMATYPGSENKINKKSFSISSPLKMYGVLFSYSHNFDLELPHYEIHNGKYTIVIETYVTDFSNAKTINVSAENTPGIQVEGTVSTSDTFSTAKIIFNKNQASGDIKLRIKIEIHFEKKPTVNRHDEHVVFVKIYGIKNTAQKIPKDMNDQFFSLTTNREMVAQRKINMGGNMIVKLGDPVEDDDGVNLKKLKETNRKLEETNQKIDNNLLTKALFNTAFEYIFNNISSLSFNIARTSIPVSPFLASANRTGYYVKKRETKNALWELLGNPTIYFPINRFQNSPVLSVNSDKYALMLRKRTSYSVEVKNPRGATPNTNKVTFFLDVIQRPSAANRLTSSYTAINSIPTASWNFENEKTREFIIVFPRILQDNEEIVLGMGDFNLISFDLTIRVP